MVLSIWIPTKISGNCGAMETSRRVVERRLSPYRIFLHAVGPKICQVHSGYNTAIVNKNCDSLLGCLLSYWLVQNWFIVFSHFVFLQLKLAELASIADDVIKLEKKVGMCHKKIAIDQSESFCGFLFRLSDPLIEPRYMYAKSAGYFRWFLFQNHCQQKKDSSSK